MIEEESPAQNNQPESNEIYTAPMSFAQQRLWFMEQLYPDSRAYTRAFLYSLTGQLNVPALERALKEIVWRHETLRTTFALAGVSDPSQDRMLVQRIEPLKGSPLLVTDLCGLPAQEREGRARQMAGEEVRQRFDLARGPLFVAHLFCLEAGEHLLLLRLHHIISDGWSDGILKREISHLYAAACAGKPSPLPELPIQYADFAAWQCETLQGEVLEDHVSYWKKQLAGAPMLDLPTDSPRPRTPSLNGARLIRILPGQLVAALKAFSQQQGGTLFMTLLAAFNILLQRYSGQTDITIGAPVANRTQAEIEGLIGFFINTLVLRSDLSGNPTFCQLLKKIQKTCIEAYTHQDLPFEKLVEVLNPQRDPIQNLFFNILFNYLNYEQANIEFPGVKVTELDPPEIPLRFPLTVSWLNTAETARIRVVFQPELFSASRMEVMLDQYIFLLQQILAAPDQPIHSYSLVNDQAARVLPDLHVELPEPYYEPVTSLFCIWANQQPDSIAIVQGKCTWTYGQLAAQARQVAASLRLQEIRKGDVVAICGQTGFQLVAGMLGVLLSGGVMLTLDPDLPILRRQTLLRESKACFLLALTPADSAGLSEMEGLQIIQITEELSQPVEAAALPNGSSPSGGDAAYIFFTSGSTGTPKAVLGSHKGLAHFLAWQRQEFKVSPRDRVAQWTKLSFDVLLRDVFLPLTSGATLVIPTPQELQQPHQVPAWLEKYQVTILHCVPTQAQSWVSHPKTGIPLPALRCIFFAGEPLSGQLVERWRSTFPGSAEMINLYGPTETTLAKCFFRLETKATPGVQSIGFPLPETQALILSKENQLCGFYEPGEIVLRTPFRSLGYINNPQDATAQRSLTPNPFRADPQDLLYYTGDLGYYRPDGSISILGRQDNQIKIRGVRIEPAEIETILEQHPAVQRAAVVAYLDSSSASELEPGERNLAAYVLPRPQAEVSSVELRRYLRQRLPENMLPTLILFLAELPLTPTGKVDRSALPPPTPQQDGLAGPDLGGAEQEAAPLTRTEERLASIWQQVLHLANISVHANFFELGGHSLRATQIIVRLNEDFQVDLPLRMLFENPTIAELAETIDNTMLAGEASDLSPRIQLKKMDRSAHRCEKPQGKR